MKKILYTILIISIILFSSNGVSANEKIDFQSLANETVQLEPTDRLKAMREIFNTEKFNSKPTLKIKYLRLVISLAEKAKKGKINFEDLEVKVKQTQKLRKMKKFVKKY